MTAQGLGDLANERAMRVLVQGARIGRGSKQYVSLRVYPLICGVDLQPDLSTERS